MAQSLEQIRRVTIESRVIGAEASTAALNKLAVAQTGVAVASKEVSPAMLSAEGALNRLRMSIDADFRSTERLAAAQKTLKLAYAEGLLGIVGTSAALVEQNRLLELSAAKFKVAGESSMFAGLGGIKAIAGGFGLFAFIDALIKIPEMIASVVRESAGLEHMAATIGINTKQLQELNFAAGQVHVTTETVSSAMERFTKNLGDVSRGGGDLFTILKANHVVISGDVMKDFLSVANLVEHASNAEERNALITKAFGKNAQEMGLLFAGGADGIRAFMEQADQIGAVIDDNTLRDIEELDKRWNAFTTTLSVGFRSAVLNTIGWFADMDNALTGLLDRIQKAGGAQLGGGVTFGAEDPLAKFVREATEADTKAKTLSDAVDKLRGKLSGSGPSVSGLVKMDFGGRFDPGATTILPSADKSGEQLRKQFETSIAAIEKQTVALRAQAATLGMSTGAAAAFTKQQELLDLAVRDHIALTPKEKAGIDAVAKAYGDATEALAKAKIAADIKWTRGTMFLSPQDLAIANQLRALYGNDIPKALGSSEAAALRFNDALKLAHDLTQDFASTFVSDLRQGKTAIDSLSDALGRLGDKLLDMALNQAINGLFAGLTGGGGGGLLGGLFGGGGLGGGGHGGLSPGANDNRVMNMPRSRSAAPASGGGGLSITVPITMAPGASNEQIARAGAVAIKEALDGFKRELPDRVHAIAANPRRR